MISQALFIEGNRLSVTSFQLIVFSSLSLKVIFRSWPKHRIFVVSGTGEPSRSNFRQYQGISRHEDRLKYIRCLEAATSYRSLANEILKQKYLLVGLPTLNHYMSNNRCLITQMNANKGNGTLAKSSLEAREVCSSNRVLSK